MRKNVLLAVAAGCAMVVCGCNQDEKKPQMDMAVEFETSTIWLEGETTCEIPLVVTGQVCTYPMTVTIESVDSDERSVAGEDYTLEQTEIVIESAEDKKAVVLTAAEGVESLNVELCIKSTDNGAAIGEKSSVRIGSGNKFAGTFEAKYTFVSLEGESSERTEDWTFDVTVMPPFPPYFGAEFNTFTGILGVVSDGGATQTFKPTLTTTDDGNIEFTINIGCGDHGSYMIAPVTMNEEQFLACLIVTDRNGNILADGNTLTFVSDGFNISLKDDVKGYLTYGLFGYTDNVYKNVDYKGYLSLEGLTIVRK